MGNTIEVVEAILKDKRLLSDLIDCYKSEDQVVRLRVSNAMKRVAKEHPDWVAARLDDLVGWIAKIDQASTKWTLSTLYQWLDSYMNTRQRTDAIEIMKQNIHYDDWIVQNTTAESLAYFARSNPELATWLIPELRTLTKSRHGSVARRAEKLVVSLEAHSATNQKESK